MLRSNIFTQKLHLQSPYMKKVIMFFGLLTFTSHVIIPKLCPTLVTFEQIKSASSHEEKRNIFLSLVNKAEKCFSATEVFDKTFQHSLINGLYLEMGVFSGGSINYIANKQKDKIIHGFDSFEGLPEHWERADTAMFAKGFFALNKLPAVAFNVKLYKGWFDHTLPEFKQHVLVNQPIAFLHIDCDIYSSTKTVFDVLGDNIVDGTIIVFDELYGYPGFENHELKAFCEFLQRKNFEVQYLAYNIRHEQVAVKLIAQ